MTHLDEADDEIAHDAGDTVLVIEHPATKIATIINKFTQEKEFVVRKDYHVSSYPGISCGDAAH